MSLIEFFNKFLFYHYKDLGLGRDYFIQPRKRASYYGELLNPDNFWDWYRNRRDQGWCNVSLSYYDRIINHEKAEAELRPKYFDRIVYDLDIPFKKEKVIELREKDLNLFNIWLRIVKRETYRLCEHLAKRYNATPIVVFTGNRGYQIHVLLDRPIEAKYYGYVFDTLLAGYKELPIPKKLVRETEEIVGPIEVHSIIDRRVRDSSHLFRLPYTRHEVTKDLSLIIDWRSLQPMRVRDILRLGILERRISVSLIKSLINILDSLTAETQALSLLNTSTRNSRTRPRPNKIKIRNEVELPEDPRELLESLAPPCIKGIWEKFKARIEVSHDERLAVLWFLMNLGYDKEKVIEVFKLLPDYNEKRTRYQVEYAYKRKYKMFNCETMRKRGIVSSELCERCPLNGRYKNPICIRFY